MAFFTELRMGEIPIYVNDNLPLTSVIPPGNVCVFFFSPSIFLLCIADRSFSFFMSFVTNGSYSKKNCIVQASTEEEKESM